MKRLVLSTVFVLLVTCASFAIPIAIFQDTPTFAERAQDIMIAKCDRVQRDKNFGDDLYPVDVTVTNVLKGKWPIGVSKIATIYPMRTGKSYLLTSLGGSVSDIAFLALPELSVVELPEGFDMSDFKGKTLEEQLGAIFSARKAEVERQQTELNREADLLTKALRKKTA
ncbi:MAG: hypothetical protein ABIP55_01680 [Tepidisphaeraceae bacterium]